MKFIEVKKQGDVTTLTLARGRVNALIGEVLVEWKEALERVREDPETRAVVLAGHGSFFSFGFDIPEFLSYSKDAFEEYLVTFTDFYTYLFVYPKPVVAALNGHAIAGGCMIALACDSIVMARGKAKISLNEITFGVPVCAGSTEMLRFRTGSANATKILTTGDMYSAEEALALGMVDEVAAKEELMERSHEIAAHLGAKDLPAFSTIKGLLRKPVAGDMISREGASLKKLLDLWYSESTWAKLQEIKIF